MVIGNGFVKIVAGDGSTFGLKGDGTLWAWGDTAFGHLGDGTHTQRLGATKIGECFPLVAAGGYETNGPSIAVKKDGSLWGGRKRQGSGQRRLDH